MGPNFSNNSKIRKNCELFRVGRNLYGRVSNGMHLGNPKKHQNFSHHGCVAPKKMKSILLITATRYAKVNRTFTSLSQKQESRARMDNFSGEFRNFRRFFRISGQTQNVVSSCGIWRFRIAVGFRNLLLRPMFGLGHGSEIARNYFRTRIFPKTPKILKNYSGFGFGVLKEIFGFGRDSGPEPEIGFWEIPDQKLSKILF